MAHDPGVDIVMAAALLKGAQPQFFQQLCDALRAYEILVIGEVLNSDTPHDMFRAQGKVKTIQYIRKNLIECAELRETYTRRSNNGR